MSRASSEALLAELRAELAAIAALISRDAGGPPREATKERLVRLFKQVEAAHGELTQLKQEIKALAERFKQLPAAKAEPPQLLRDVLGASTFLEKGWNLIAAGDSAGAMKALRRALELSPGDPQAQSLLGWAEMQSGRLDDALLTFSRVLVQEPGNALARVNLGYICLKKRVFGEAIEHLARVIRTGSDPKALLYAHYYLGLVYLERGMFADAQSFLKQAIAIGPNLIEAYHELGRAQWLAGAREAARATWTTGAASRRTPWAKACQELLDRTQRGEEVPRSASP